MTLVVFIIINFIIPFISGNMAHKNTNKQKQKKTYTHTHTQYTRTQRRQKHKTHVALKYVF